MEDIKVYELSRMDLRGATVIDGFPSVGLVSTICANYIISSLNLTQIGIMDSIYFPTVSVVRDSEPLNPVRIYGGRIVDKDEEERSVVVFISEFQPPPKLIKLIAGTILDWIGEQNCGILVSPEGLVIERANEPSGTGGEGIFNSDALQEALAQSGGEVQGASDEEKKKAAALNIAMEIMKAQQKSPRKKEEERENDAPQLESEDGTDEEELEPRGDIPVSALARAPVEIYGIASTSEARKLLENPRIMPFSEGVISGVAGVLLNEGKRRGFNVISLLAETRTEYPDARAAAKVIEAMDEIVLRTGIDVEPLYKEAESIEVKIRMMRAQMSSTKKVHSSPSMYG